MGLVRILLPLPRAAARWAPEKGGPLLGAALSYCVTPSWAGLPPPSPARRLAWAEEAVAVYRASADAEGLSRALALRAHALLLFGRFEEACTAADEVACVRGAQVSGVGEVAGGRGAEVSGVGEAAGGSGAQVSGADELTVGLGAQVSGADELTVGLGAQVSGVDEAAGGRACTGAADALGVPGAVSPAVAAFVGDVRARALAGVGRSEEALAVARACVVAYRGLSAPDRRDRALGSLPGALRTYGMLLAAAGRCEESVAVYEECAALLAAMSLRELARVELVRPQVLAELVGVLRTLGRHQDALGVGPEAREALRGPLAWTVPEVVLPLRVRLLVDLARCHTATGDPAEARVCAVAAVAEARKPHGAGELTSALDCLADVLGELGQTDKESITRRELAELHDT